jgi:hypothetical protein
LTFDVSADLRKNVGASDDAYDMMEVDMQGNYCSPLARYYQEIGIAPQVSRKGSFPILQILKNSICRSACWEKLFLAQIVAVNTGLG